MLRQQENRGASFLTFQFFFIKHLKGTRICYCRWVDYWTRVKEPDPIYSYRNNKQLNKAQVQGEFLFDKIKIPQTLLFFW